MPRAIWKGAISFGLVHVPVALYPAASESGIDFDWIDKRSMDPVGYKRVNKRSGREVAKEHIARGVKVDDGDYVLLSDDEIKAAYPKTTQTISIEAFVHASEIPFTHLETPYYLEPINRGTKVYALLREAMRADGVIGIARVVMHTKEHLAALVPVGSGLLLNTLRWAEEIRPWTGLDLPAEGTQAGKLKGGELMMARKLVADMTEKWRPERYVDKFTAAVHALVARRIEAGQTEPVQALEEIEAGSSNVVDLTELLARSLGKGSAKGGKPARKTVARKTAPRKAAARKRA